MTAEKHEGFRVLRNVLFLDVHASYTGRVTLGKSPNATLMSGTCSYMIVKLR